MNRQNGVPGNHDQTNRYTRMTTMVIGIILGISGFELSDYPN